MYIFIQLSLWNRIFKRKKKRERNMNAGALAEENRRKVFKQDIHRRRIPVNRNRPADFLCVAMAID